MSNHSFDIHIATEYKSVDIAILVWHFQYWIMKNKRLGRNQHEGRTWTYQTLEEITAIFPYWSFDQVKRLINKSIQLGILIKGNFNKAKFDRTVWYAFKDEEKFSIWRIRQMDIAESPNGISEIATPIPNTLPNTLTDKEREEASSPPAPTSFKSQKKEKSKIEKKSYRENVNLTEAEHSKLLSQYGEDKLKWMLDYLDAKKGSNGNSYKSDYHVLLPINWVNSEYQKQHKEEKNPVIKSKDCREHKKLVDFFYEKFNSTFTGYVHFQPYETHVSVYHQDKRISKDLIYQQFQFEDFKEIFERFLQESGFIKKQQSERKIGNLISGLAQQFKTVGAR